MEREGGAVALPPGLKIVEEPTDLGEEQRFRSGSPLPKAWMLAAATAGSFMASNASVASIAIIAIVFWIAAIGNLVTWAWLGAALRSLLGIGSRMRTFNVAMGTLLAATALWLVML